MTLTICTCDSHTVSNCAFLIELKDNSPTISQSMEEDDLQQGEKQFGWDFVFTDSVKMDLLA